MIVQAGFMQAPTDRRVAWCARCGDAMECDERGCVVCELLAQKKRESTRTAHLERKAVGKCINGPKHEQPVLKPDGSRFTRCESCRETHRRTW